jgi:hypothetical protein
VELRLDRVCFTLPVEHKLVFVEQGLVRLRYSMPGLPHHEAEARVAETVHEGALRIYALRIGSVSDPEAHRCICSALARVLDTDQP